MEDKTGSGPDQAFKASIKWSGEEAPEHEETLEEAVERRYGVLEEFLKHAKMDTKKKRAKKKQKGLSKKEKRRRRSQRKRGK